MAARRSNRPIKVIREASECFFCKEKIDPNYRDVENIGRYVSDRARIYQRARSGICAKHQRKLAVAVKRARHLALLPFATKV